jgi:hypothetical protein
MATKGIKLNPKLQAWVEARARHHLSHAQVQMARELGMNPNKLGRLDNHKQEPWKAPLPEFIERLYFKRFGKRQPEKVQSIEERCRVEMAKKDERRAAKQEHAASKDKSVDPPAHAQFQCPAPHKV